jgi:hypothetical protein
MMGVFGALMGPALGLASISEFCVRECNRVADLSEEGACYVNFVNGFA